MVLGALPDELACCTVLVERPMEPEDASAAPAGGEPAGVPVVPPVAASEKGRPDATARAGERRPMDRECRDEATGEDCRGRGPGVVPVGVLPVGLGVGAKPIAEADASSEGAWMCMPVPVAWVPTLAKADAGVSGTGVS